MQIWTCFSLGLWIFDVITDFATGVKYIINGDTWWGAPTLAFTVVTLVITNVISALFYYHQLNDATDQDNDNLDLGKLWKIFLIFTHVLQLGALFRFLHKLSSPKTKSNEDTLMIVCRFEAFLESAPQLVLQCYIMTQMLNVYWLTGASIVFSLASLVWVTDRVYKRNEVEDMSVYGICCRWFAEFCLFMWPLFTITPRVLSFAVFASYYTWILFPVVGCHWIVMRIEFYYTEGDKNIANMATGLLTCFVKIFIHFEWYPDDRSFRLRISTYLSLIFVENTIMFALWFTAVGLDTNYGVPLAAVVWGGFFLGIMFMSIYFHLKEASTSRGVAYINRRRERQSDGSIIAK